MSHFVSSATILRSRGVQLLLGVLAAVVVGWSTARAGVLVPALLIVLAVVVPFVIILFTTPRVGIIALLCYCFLFFIIDREVGGAPYGMAIDGLLVTTAVAVLVQHRRFDWSYLKNDLVLLTLFWFVVNILELGNPSGASLMGWVQEFRSASFYWLLTVPLSLLLFNQKKDLNLFLVLLIGLSVLGTLNGLKQLYIGLSPGEQQFLDEGNAKTHLLWGKLRVFSFYSDAGQFGASQAHIALIALILGFGPFKKWQKTLLLLAAGLLITGMFISGTRGALFALIVGIGVALLISKNIKALVVGSVLALSALYVLKYTHIGDTNYNIYRMRTALDPQDASLNVRLNNQLVLRNYLESHPFGGGVGTIGAWGIKYNPGSYLSTIPPDSYWVKVWVMYGIVGFIIWFGIMLYIVGKGCGIVWNIRDPKLRVKLNALTAGAAGILFCSYGNEVINFMPSAIIVYISWAFIFLGPRLDSEPEPVQQ
ncbi:O-antigen ligase family protein [Hymenobacter sp. HSC-4F20]|uniref:O-antigen ligase family protein n=1 Tax=Hymenobacter sp. HSC-4F20 TaxID=2864135 RepID=UPI001C733BFB|nr:O-antigen ligase family protein [Hymenobacter sp. HSC-4F20]MBX0290496.1 O-antigen ligase family protein [Hymenobacter sp. HSC-4F20]